MKERKKERDVQTDRQAERDRDKCELKTAGVRDTELQRQRERKSVILSKSK